MKTTWLSWCISTKLIKWLSGTRRTCGQDMGGGRTQAAAGTGLFARSLTWQFKPFSWFLTIPLTSPSCSFRSSRIFGCSCNVKAENWLAEVNTVQRSVYIIKEKNKINFFNILNIVKTSSVWDLHSFIRCMLCPPQCMIYRALKMLKGKKKIPVSFGWWQWFFKTLLTFYFLLQLGGRSSLKCVLWSLWYVPLSACVVSASDLVAEASRLSHLRSCTARVQLSPNESITAAFF